MPRLPGPEALGNLPSLRPGDRPAQISGNDPIAEGLARAGKAMVDLSEQERQREDALQTAEADAQLSTRLIDLRRRFDTDGDWRTMQPRFMEEADRIRTEAAERITNPRTRERWAPRADVATANAFDHMRGRQDRLRGDSEFGRLEGVLGQRTEAYRNAPDDDTRTRTLQDIQDTIELGRRSGLLNDERLRNLTQRFYHGTIENDALTRPDNYAALLELREGDTRARQPSSGQVSELGLAYIQRLNPPAPGQTATQTAAATRRLRTEAAEISGWITRNFVTEGDNPQPLGLTQLQHDALVGLAVRSGRNWQDTLNELLPSVRTGNWDSVSSTVRAGGLFGQETSGERTMGGAGTAPPRGHLEEANRDLTLTPQERALYEYHLNNLHGPGGIDQEGGARSTLLITRVEIDGRTYLLPTVFNGRTVQPGTPEFRAAIEAAGGLDRFPSYATDNEARTRYDRLHRYFERDTQDYQRGRRDGTTTTPPPSGAGASDLIDRSREAIGRLESGGRARPYQTTVESNSPARGRQEALGRYGIMDFNLAEWSRAALGRTVTREEFLASPEIQDRIFNHRFGLLLQEEGGNAGNAAQRWFAGSLTNTAPDRFGTRGPGYRERFLSALGPGGGGTITTTPPGEQPPPPTTDPRTEEIGDMLVGQGPSSRYRNLPPDRRRALITRLSETLRPELMAAMESDLELIRQTGQPTRLPDGTTHFDRAARVLTGNQFARYRLRLEEAYGQYRALNGLQDMAHEQIENHLNSIAPGRGGEGETFHLRQRNYNLAATAVDRMNEEGRRDAARAVETGLVLRGVGTRRRDVVGPDGQTTTTGETDIDHRLQPAREVREAHQLVRRIFANSLTFTSDTNGNLNITAREGHPMGGRHLQEAWGIIIDARLAAQTRRGITDEYRAPITRGEATDLLRLPRRLSSIDDREFNTRIEAAIARARERYGPYANMALDVALRFASLNEQRQSDATGLVRRFLTGETITRQDLERLTSERRLRTEEDAWLGPTLRPPSGVPGVRLDRAAPGLLGPRPDTVPGSELFVPPTPGNLTTLPPMNTRPEPGAGYGPGLTRRRPPPAEVQYLLANPSIWREFDRDYGPGSASEYLRQLPQP